MQPLRSQRANGMPPNILKASLASVPARNMQCTLASKGHATACSHGRTMQKSFWLSQDACARGSAEGLKSRQVMSKDSVRSRKQGQAQNTDTKRQHDAYQSCKHKLQIFLLFTGQVPLSITIFATDVEPRRELAGRYPIHNVQLKGPSCAERKRRPAPAIYPCMR